MDLATLAGMAIAWVMIIWAFLMEGGSISSLLQITAAMIIFGGTIGATLMAFPMSDIRRALTMFKRIFISKEEDKYQIIQQLIDYAAKARREGVLCLEVEVSNNPNSLIRKGLKMVVDGMEQETVKGTLENEIHLMENEYHVAAGVFEAAGGFAPTMGIIGTVLGLISVLANLDDPSTLGPKIALAFVATFMGILSANILWLPFANKLKIKGKNEKMINEIILEGLICIQEGQNPRMMEDKLYSVLLEEATGRK